jgi:hypothetical protein
MSSLRVPELGVGVGLRPIHHRQILDEKPRVDWFECISENFLIDGGEMLDELRAVRASYPVVLHGVSLDIGGSDPLDRQYLRRLRALIDEIRPPWVSDHLCWCASGGVHLHDLLPLPLTREAVAHVAERVRRVQGELGVPFALENVSSYLTFRADEMPEHAFVAEVLEAADCGLLLDVNNVFVSAKNHGFDPLVYLDAMPPERVVQMHLAGHLDRGRFLHDNHGGHVCDEVWDLYRHACRRVGRCSTLIEWDDAIPPLDVLLAEADRARTVREETLGAHAA